MIVTSPSEGKINLFSVAVTIGSNPVKEITPTSGDTFLLSDTATVDSNPVMAISPRLGLTS